MAGGDSAHEDRGLLVAGYSGMMQSGGRIAATNLVIGNNGTAVAAAAEEARRLGYEVVSATSANQSEGLAEDVGRQLAQQARELRATPGRQCVISGGEPVVTLVDAAHRGLGGRNQQLVLAALGELGASGIDHFTLLSGGTDGEDGPTNAAGAVLDVDVIELARKKGLDARDYLARNDAYHFFERLGALIKTGPTHTNVCDLRVVLTH